MQNDHPPSLHWFRRLHILLGIVVSVPVLAWSLSGFFLALPPGSVSGEAYRVIETERIKVSPAMAAAIVTTKVGGKSTITSLGLEQRGEFLRYSVFAGGQSYWVNAESGELSQPPPPSPRTRWVRHAHFFNFAGSHRTLILVGFSLLAALSVASGLLLVATEVRKRMRASPGRPAG